MNNAELKRTIKYLKRELLAQKQAFQRGLNRTEWSWLEKTQGYDVPPTQRKLYDFSIAFNFNDSVVVMPFCQVYFKYLNDITIYPQYGTCNKFNWNPSTHTVTIGGTMWLETSYAPDGLSIYGLSSEIIQDITITLTLNPYQ